MAEPPMSIISSSDVAFCKICSTVEPKYCCPGCSTRTCSLACYKRHKAWSSCSGKRNPASYLKRNQLATPSGIDRDYNFLSGVERALGRAEHDAERRGIKLESPGQGRAGESKLERAMRDGRVEVVKVPKGMSRQKENRTAWDGRTNSIDWTVEWMLPNGERLVRHLLEQVPIQQAYDNLSPLKSAGVKRKRKHAQHAHQRRGYSQHPVESDNTTAAALAVKSSPTALPQEDEDATGSGNLKRQDVWITTEKDIVPSTVTPPTSTTSTVVHATVKQSSPQTQDSPGTIQAERLSPHSRDQPPLHFYLHIPGLPLPAQTKALHSIASDATLRDVLMDRRVLEFPTIFVLHDPPDRLPPGFVHEAGWKGYSSGVESRDPEIKPSE